MRPSENEKIDVNAIKEIFGQTPGDNKFPITTHNTGDQDTYQHDVGHETLNGAIMATPSVKPFKEHVKRHGASNTITETKSSETSETKEK